MNKTIVISVVAIIVTAASIGGGIGLSKVLEKDKPATGEHGGGHQASKQDNSSKNSYTFNLMTGVTYPVSSATEIRFDIQDKGNKLKSFDTVHEKQMHMIIVRKDRTNFQHVHPELDVQTGEFSIKNVIFPTDGEYRVFADFTLAETKAGDNGSKPPTTLFQDVKVGDVFKYQPTSLPKEKLTSNKDGFDTSIFDGGSDGGGSGYTEGTTSSVAVAIDKNGQPFKQLERYLGALGHMVVLSPSLEYIHAHALSEDVMNQGGVVSFAVDFPKQGTYAAFLQTQAASKVSTFDYVLNVKGNRL